MVLIFPAFIFGFVLFAVVPGTLALPRPILARKITVGNPNPLYSPESNDSTNQRVPAPPALISRQADVPADALEAAIQNERASALLDAAISQLQRQRGSSGVITAGI